MALGQDPSNAAAWNALCSPEEALSWVRMGYDAAAAGRWKRHGFDPLELSGWMRVGVAATADILEWRHHGFHPDSAKPWIAAGVSGAAEARRWREAFLSPANRARWLKDGFSADDALRLRAAGVGHKDARAMRDVGAPLDEIPQWVASDIGPREAKQWIDAGVTAADCVAWSKQGGWKAFRRWAGRASVRDFKGFTAGWAAAGASAAAATDWLAVTNDPRIASQWTSLGMQSATAREWVRAGFGHPADAEVWLRLGLEPRQAAAWAASAGSDAPAWYQATRGDLASVAAWRAAGAASGAEAWAWSHAGFVPADLPEWTSISTDPAVCAAWRGAIAGAATQARRWIAAGVIVANDAAAMRAAGVDPSEAAQWMHMGVVSAPEILRWRAQWPAAESGRWFSTLRADLTTCWQWRQLLDGDLDTAAAMRAAGFTPRDAHAWLERGMPAGEAAAWRTLGCPSVEIAKHLAASGVTADEAGRWADIGVGLAAIADWRSTMSAADAAMWVDAVGSIERIAPWQRIADRQMAGELVRGGIDDPNDARRWLDAGFGTSAAISWKRSGLAVERASQWRDAGLTAEHAAAWGPIADDPATAGEWMAACAGDAEAAQLWFTAGVASASRVSELLAIGLTARAHAELARVSADAADYAARVRVQAARHSGLDVAADGMLVLHVDDERAADIAGRLDAVLAAAARAGEHRLRVRHGAPRLSPESVRLLPEARFVRGAAKAAVLKYGWERDGGRRFAICDDGAHSEFDVDASPSPTAFIRIGAEAVL